MACNSRARSSTLRSCFSRSRRSLSATVIAPVIVSPVSSASSDASRRVSSFLMLRATVFPHRVESIHLLYATRTQRATNYSTRIPLNRGMQPHIVAVTVGKTQSARPPHPHPHRNFHNDRCLTTPPPGSLLPVTPHSRHRRLHVRVQWHELVEPDDLERLFDVRLEAADMELALFGLESPRKV